MISKRLAALSGVIFVALVVVGIVALGGDTPDGDASAAKLASFYDAHQARQIAAAFLLAAAVPFLVVFGVGLARSLWPADGEGRPRGQLVLVAGSAIARAAFLLAACTHFALTDAADKVSGDALRALNLLDTDTWVAFNGGLGVMMLGAALCLIPRALAERALGWAALVLGVALFVPFADFFALLVTGLWILVVSAMRLMGEATPAAHLVPREAAR